MVIASHYEPSIEVLESGPIAVVNGQRIGTTGAANPKGSVDGEATLSSSPSQWHAIGVSHSSHIVTLAQTHTPTSAWT